MTKIQIEVPDSTAQAAGLLTPQAMERLLSNALRKQQTICWPLPMKWLPLMCHR